MYSRTLLHPITIGSFTKYCARQQQKHHFRQCGTGTRCSPARRPIRSSHPSPESGEQRSHARNPFFPRFSKVQLSTMGRQDFSSFRRRGRLAGLQAGDDPYNPHRGYQPRRALFGGHDGQEKGLDATESKPSGTAFTLLSFRRARGGQQVAAGSTATKNTPAADAVTTEIAVEEQQMTQEPARRRFRTPLFQKLLQSRTSKKQLTVDDPIVKQVCLKLIAWNVCDISPRRLRTLLSPQNIS
jgi:hypothetical protein